MKATDDLIEGYRRFRKGAYADQRARFDSLSTEGQHPRTMVIACSDSRVDPTIVFDAGPGELFVVRNIANLVPPFEIGGGGSGDSAALDVPPDAVSVKGKTNEGVGAIGRGDAVGTQAAALLVRRPT